MALAAEQELKHLGETAGCKDHDHDLVHELSRRLDALWRFDQYIANASDRPELRQIWEKMKQQEQDNIDTLKAMVRQEIQEGCF